MRLLAAALLAFAGAASAHPMGNFSVGQHSGVTVSAEGVEVAYVLDLAEMPTYELRPRMELAPAEPMTLAAVEKFRAQAAPEWIAKLALKVGGAPVALRPGGGRAAITPGAGGLPTVRFEVTAAAPWPPGTSPERTVRFEDANFSGRTGWKEVVLAAGPGARVVRSSVPAQSASAALTRYPDEATASPPRVLSAEAVVELVEAPRAQPGGDGLDAAARAIAGATCACMLVGMLAAVTTARARAAPADGAAPEGRPAHPPHG